MKGKEPESVNTSIDIHERSLLTTAFYPSLPETRLVFYRLDHSGPRPLFVNKVIIILPYFFITTAFHLHRVCRPGVADTRRAAERQERDPEGEVARL